MDYTALAAVVEAHAAEISAKEPQGPLDDDTNELVRVLARILAGAPIDRAFGAPGHWGYGNPIGKALASAYRSASHPATA